MTAIDDIKARIDIVSYIGQHVKLEKAGRYWKACCPFHSERTASFMVSPDRQTWRCYGACGEGGDLFAFAMKFHNWDFVTAKEELARIAGVEIEHTKHYRRDETLRAIMVAAADAYHQLLLKHPGAQAARDYLAGRGIQSATIERFGLGIHPGGPGALVEYLIGVGYKPQDIVTAGLAVQRGEQFYDRLRNRLIIPIRDGRGRAVALAGRRMDGNNEAKYINTPNTPIFTKGDYLYGLDRDAIRADTVVVVEGYMDVLAAHQAGFTNVVGQMGTALTDAQLEYLKAARTIILALDGDEAGRKAARRDLHQAIKASRDVRILTLPDGQDPDDVIRAQRWLLLLQEAEPVADYLIRLETTHITTSTSIHEREALARQLAPVLAAVESDIYKRDNLQKLAAALYLPLDAVFALAPSNTSVPKAPIASASAPSARQEPIQVYCIHALLENPEWLSHVQEDDFTGEYRLLLDILARGGDVRAEADESLLPLLDTRLDAPVTEATFKEQIRRLRVRRLQEEIDQRLLLGDLDTVRELNREKAKLLFG